MQDLVDNSDRSHLTLAAAFGFFVLCPSVTGLLPAAELATDFPNPPIPLELAPRMGRPSNDNAVFQQQLPVPGAPGMGGGAGFLM
jgi:hypothetical protein